MTQRGGRPDLDESLRVVIDELRDKALQVDEPPPTEAEHEEGEARPDKGVDGASRVRVAVSHPGPSAATVAMGPGFTDEPTAASLVAIGVQRSLRLRPTGPEPPPGLDDSARYEVGREVGRGGMGRVLLATDGELGRRVALKILLHDSPEKAQRFVEEAQVAAQLEHPNIVPVYDFGVLSSGTPYFTMRYVHGRTLKEILRALRADPASAVFAEFTRTRLLGIFRTVCMAVAYAHARGVVHRDIKPQNVMIGSHGEVYVMDWGLAKLVGRPEPTGADPKAVSVRLDDLDQTHAGTVKGTPQYMSPEQASGDVEHQDERTDIYALGAVLYETLTFHPPYVGGDASEVVQRVKEETPTPPRDKAPEREIPGEVEDICMRAMAREPWRRFASARELADEIERYLEGSREKERRRHEARRRVTAAQDTALRYAALTQSATDLAREAESSARRLKGWEPLEHKEAIWELEDRASAAAEAAADAYGEAVHLYTEALAWDAGDRDAREGLAALYYAKFLEAEDRRDSRESRTYRALLEQYQDERYATLLRGDGGLRIVTDPPAVTCQVFTHQESGRRLMAMPSGTIGPTPVSIQQLAMGSYLLVASAEGFAEVRVPFIVERCATARVSIRMRGPTEIPEGYCRVPAGPFVSGGDPLAFGSPPRATVELPDFAIARFPVTCAEYLEFVNALAEHDPEEAQRRVPRSEPRGGWYWSPGPDGTFALPMSDREGVAWDPRWPATGITFHDALAYAEWAAATTRLPLRLPTDLEWEKAARGVDGRIFPWGNAFDPTFCKMWSSRPGKKGIEPIGTFPTDESVYGVRDLAGGAQEWVDAFTDREANIRVRMGGSWRVSANACRCACRYGWPPDVVYPDIGVRLALSL